MDTLLTPAVPSVPVPETGRDTLGHDLYRPTLLDVPISFFNTIYANIPSQTTTLRRMVTTRYYRPQSEAIRNEPDEAKQKALKNELPAFTLALLYHRREGATVAEQVSQQWPMLMGDIDVKDNPGLSMALLKQDLARLPYVLLCAHSVRGGLWFVVRLPDKQTPTTLQAHYGYVKKLFANRFGITLDRSKGGNPTHLRYASYDPAPYINETATVLSGTYVDVPQKPKRRPLLRNNNLVAHDLLRRILNIVEQASEGERHNRLLSASRLAGGYIATGYLNEQDAVYGLETVASEWPNFSKSQRTIRDGIRYGQQAPIKPYPEDNCNRPAIPRERPLIVKTFADWAANPGSILRPDESQIERL